MITKKRVTVPYPKKTTVLYINGRELFLNYVERQCLLVALSCVKPQDIEDAGCKQYRESLNTLKEKLLAAVVP